LVLALVAAAPAADPKPAKERPREGLIVRLFGPVPDCCIDQLDLSADQKEKVKALAQEQEQKNKQVVTSTALKLYGIINSCRRDDGTGEPAPGLAIAHEIVGGVLECRRSRVNMERQLQGVLSPEQKEKFVQLTQERPHRANRKAQRQADRDGDDEPTAMSRRAIKRLRLDPEQEKKLAQIHDETEAKVRAVLTEEQRKKFDQMARRAGEGERKSLKPKERPNKDRD